MAHLLFTPWDKTKNSFGATTAPSPLRLCRKLRRCNSIGMLATGHWNISGIEPRSVKGAFGHEGVVDNVDLEGGTIIPGLTSFCALLGLEEIRLEPSTNNGRIHNPLHGDLPAVLGDTVMRAQAGLTFGGQNLLLPYRGSVTTVITAPSGTFLQGISTAFSPGAVHARVDACIRKASLS
ncbi:hypothetical protein P692DRAFT_201861945 [Suillus brevipes Sb2]|nr:hypothetical protein P692DRAFT_201861945 [Suillus brevipes Sb2]